MLNLKSIELMSTSRATTDMRYLLKIKKQRYKQLEIFNEAYDEIHSTHEYLYPRYYEVELLKEYIQNNEIDRKYARKNALNQLEGNINNLNSIQYREAIKEI
ncbi:40576_t:CDS:2, partial [Gigaspora margarita]